MLNGHETRRNKVSPKSCLELVPNYLNVSREGGPVMGPLDACRALELVSCIRSLHSFSQTEQSKPLLYRAQPFISLLWFFYLMKDRRLCVYEVLKAAILVRLGSLANMPILTVSHLAHSLS